eukprot:6207424-Pleurochrysis_carterae.AAC.2
MHHARTPARAPERFGCPTHASARTHSKYCACTQKCMHRSDLSKKRRPSCAQGRYMTSYSHMHNLLASSDVEMMSRLWSRRVDLRSHDKRRLAKVPEDSEGCSNGNKQSRI